MEKLKILILSDYAYIKGGAEKVAIITATGFAEKGYEVKYFSAVGPVCKQLKDSKVKEVICLGQKDILDNPNKIQAMFSGIYNREAAKRLKMLFKSWIPDIVHIHSLSKALSWAVINVIHSYNIPIIYTLHDYGLICPNMGIYNFKAGKNCDLYKPNNRFKCLVTNCDKRNYAQKLWRWTRFIINIYIFRVVKKIDGFIAVSNFIGNLIEDNLRMASPIRVIYNPIEVIGKNSSIEKFYESRNQFLYAGRLSEEKGIELLLEAVKEIEAQLVIIGDGELLEYCRQFSKQLGNEKIKVMGYQNKDIIEKEMEKSIALVLPSKWMEPAPLVLNEAAAKGLATVVPDHGSSLEFVEDKINGLYFAAGNPKSLTEKLKILEQDPPLAKKLGENAKEKLLKSNYNINTYISSVLKFYLDIMQARI
jgi:glycosyltransferase involved in cell wall biosynthesis